MANTYTQLNVHAVFAVKGRGNYLDDSFKNNLHKYISGILKNLRQYPLSVGGYKDHLHIFYELNPDTSVSEVLEKVKSNSSKWINENKFVAGKFEWQRGYGGFTYARSQRNDVINYIMNQETHHQKRTFKEEYLELLKKFEIEFNEEYIFEFYE
jgi:putative transposase